MQTISEQALIKRINRHLDGERLHKLRGERWRSDLGEHYIVDNGRNVITAQHVDINVLAGELGIQARC